MLAGNPPRPTLPDGRACSCCGDSGVPVRLEPTRRSHYDEGGEGSGSSSSTVSGWISSWAFSWTQVSAACRATSRPGMPEAAEQPLLEFG